MAYSGYSKVTVEHDSDRNAWILEGHATVLGTPKVYEIGVYDRYYDAEHAGRQIVDTGEAKELHIYDTLEILSGREEDSDALELALKRLGEFND